MNTTEFKAWFDGFSEAIGKDEMLTLSQWKRIQEEVTKLTPEIKVVQTPAPLYPPGIRGGWPEKINEYDGGKWNQPGKITCGPALTQNYGTVVDKLCKNGTHEPESGIMEEVLNRG